MVYWLFFLFIMYVLLGHYGKSSNQKLLLLLIVFVAVFFSTFRDGLGVDYTAYKSYCESNWTNSIGWLLTEPIPASIYSFCYNSSFSAVVFFFITSLLTCGFSFWVYSRYDNFWLAAFVFLTYTNLYLMSFNLVRQFVASSLVLFGTYLFVIKKKSPWFFLFVLLAFLWHKSSIISVFIYFLNDKKINPAFWFFAIILSWTFPVDLLFNIPFFNDIIAVLDYTENLTYNRESYSRTSISNLYVHYIIFFLFINSKNLQEYMGEDNKGFFLVLKLSIISIIFSNISANSLPFAYRYAIFFSPFLPLLFTYLPTIADKKTVFSLAVIPVFILLMLLLTLKMDDRLYCPQRILPIESVFDDYYNPYENPDVDMHF